MEFKEAVKEIFLQCLNEPDILGVIKDKLNGGSTVCTYKESQMQQDSCSHKNNNNHLDNTILLEKIEEILSNQRKILDLTETKIDKDTKKEDELSAKLENAKKEYALQIKNLSENSEKEIRQYKEKLEICEKQNSSLAVENKNIKEQISKYSIFKECLEIYDCLQTLNNDNQKYIESLCGGFHVLAVLSLGRDDDKIEQLWSYLRDMAVKGDAEKTETLKINRYFEFCLEVANSAKPENEKYAIMDIELEDEFEPNTHIRTCDSKQIGKIKEIAVKGILVGKNIKYQAVVKVG